MRRIRISLQILILIVTVLQLVSCQAPQGSEQRGGSNVADVSNQIRPEAIQAHIEFLADDALEGRGTGSRGYELAAKYLRAHLLASGINGGAGNEKYFQKVPLVRTSVEPQQATMQIDELQLTLDTDFILLDTHRELSGKASGKVVFAGYGVTAPEFGYDDYADLDTRGAIVAFMEFEAPPLFPSAVRAYYSDQNVKIANATAHGAIGTLFIRSPVLERMFPWEGWLRELDIGWNSLRWLKNDGLPGGMTEESLVVGLLNRSGSELLFDGEAHDLQSVLDAAAAGQPPTFALLKTVTIEYQASHEQVDSVNIIGLLEGSDPKLKDEYVVYTAHVDHLGIGPKLDGDSIYNGALDNASGCAVLLEVAHAFAALPQRPKRSILFVFVTGEEAGLLGADYFVHHPTVPIERIVANINIDGAISLTPVSSVVAFGAEHSSFGVLTQSAASRLDLTVSPDPFPEEGFFVRSDQYPFIKKGIPSVFLMMGFESTSPDIDALEVFKNWLVTNYHTPKDDISQPLDFESSARMSRFAFTLGYLIAMEPQRPRWNESDFFGNKFGNR